MTAKEAELERKQIMERSKKRNKEKAELLRRDDASETAAAWAMQADFILDNMRLKRLQEGSRENRIYGRAEVLLLCHGEAEPSRYFITIGDRFEECRRKSDLIINKEARLAQVIKLAQEGLIYEYTNGTPSCGEGKPVSVRIIKKELYKDF